MREQIPACGEPTLKRQLSKILLSTVAAATLISAPLPRAEATPAFPTHKCGSFRIHQGGSYPVTYRITVFNHRVGCRVAKTVIRDFWSGENVTRHGGPSDAESYWTIKGWPGWRCGQGAGAGLCHRHSKVAAYEARVA